MSVDTPVLPAHFTRWLASFEAGFVRYKLVWCNWDVEELEAKATEIKESDLFTPSAVGWPYSP